MKKILASLILTVIVGGVAALVFFASPSVANAQAKLDKPTFNGLVPCGKNSGTAEEMAPCTLCHFIVGFQRLTKYAFYLVTTLAFAGIFISGAMYIISVGDDHLMQQAKSFITASLIGFAVVLGAWLIVNVTLWAIAKKDDLGIGKTEWNKFTCSTASSVK